MPVSRKHFVKSFLLFVATIKNRNSILHALDGTEKISVPSVGSDQAAPDGRLKKIGII